MPIDPNILERILDNDVTMTSLDLGCNQLGDADAAALAEALTHNTTLTHLGLWNNQIGSAGATVLAEAFKTNTTLTSLNLLENQIGDAGARDFAEALKANTSLLHLDLSTNQIGDAGAAALAEALTHNTTLTHLDLQENQIDAVGATALAEALTHNTTLTDLDLSENQIGDAGVTVLAATLKINTTLTHLDLSQNQIGAAGATALVETLKCNNTLTYLNLAWSQMGAVEAKALAKALKTNDTLTHLSLCGIKMGSLGVTALARTLEINTTLTNLNLGYIKIGALDAKALAEALKTNTTLKCLYLAGNQIGVDGTKALAEALKTNTTLIQLDLGGNKIDNDQLLLVKSYLARNQKMEVIKAAWTHPIVGYSRQEHETYLNEIKKKLTKSSGEEVDAVIMAILDYRFFSGEDACVSGNVVLEALSEYLQSVEIDVESLPDTAYPRELRRLLAGKVNAKNVLDIEAQVYALNYLSPSFADKDLQKEAIAELIGLLNNGFFGELERDSTQRRVIDVLILTLSCQLPGESDLMRFASAASARLAKSENLTLVEINTKLENKETVIAEFKERLRQVYGIAEYSPDVMMGKCLEEINEAFIQQTPSAPSPNMHVLFQPAATPVETEEKLAPKPFV